MNDRLPAWNIGKRIKYSEEIKSLQQKIRETEKILDSHMKHLSSIKRQHREFENEMHLLEEFIEKNRKMIFSFSSDYMSLDEAQKRLKALNP